MCIYCIVLVGFNICNDAGVWVLVDLVGLVFGGGCAVLLVVCLGVACWLLFGRVWLLLTLRGVGC